MEKSLVIKAPAKVNLYLRVLGKREDGYHEIETLFQMIDLCDTITLAPHPSGFILRVEGLSVPQGPENLALGAAKLLAAKVGIPAGVAIHLRKRIPVASGLGGGSSDAAAVLKGLNRLYRLGLSEAELHAFGAELGADVPFFLNSAVAIGRGRGELLEPIESRCSFWLALVTPPIPIRAAWAYGRLSLPLTTDRPDITICQGLVRGEEVRLLAKHLHNDLEFACVQEFPQILDLKSRLLEEGAAATLMTGSGPTVFGLFESQKEARRCCKNLSSGGCTCLVAKAITEMSEIHPS